jgi:dienelactone hydrolase
MSSEWSITSILAPVITRLQISGINPIDLAYVQKSLEDEVVINASTLSNHWYRLWKEKADFYSELARKAATGNNVITARSLFHEAARCWFAVYLVHYQDIEQKHEHYTCVKDCFNLMVQHGGTSALRVTVQLSEGGALAAYLYLPRNGKPAIGSVVLYSGLGSCKEEMHFLAESIVDRDVAVLVPDMPGCGETLFDNDVRCVPSLLEDAYRACLCFLQTDHRTRRLPVGSCGLCMGGGYAFRAAALNKAYALCATLFPLFISEVADGRTPQWMMSGKWYGFQTGDADPEDFRSKVGFNRNERIQCPFYLVHGSADNWMSIGSALRLTENVDHPVVEKLIVEKKPADSADLVVVHMLPVGEQLYWVKHLLADWMRKQFAGGPEET